MICLHDWHNPLWDDHNGMHRLAFWRARLAHQRFYRHSMNQLTAVVFT